MEKMDRAFTGGSFALMAGERRQQPARAWGKRRRLVEAMIVGNFTRGGGKESISLDRGHGLSVLWACHPERVKQRRLRPRTSSEGSRHVRCRAGPADCAVDPLSMTFQEN